MAIQVSGVNVIDDERNLNVGVLTATSLDVPPQAITFSPTDNSSDVTISSNIVITFNVDVTKGSGNITLRDGSASGTVIETIAVSSGSVSISGGAVTINPSDFPTGKNIFVVVDAGAFTSSSLGSETDLINTYNFSTGPITTSSFNPSDGATGVAVDSNIVITFSENITKETTAATKYITIRSGSASGTALQTIDVSTSAVSVSGTQATINPPSDMAFETDQYIVVDENSFFNSDGDADSGNDVINTYNFTTLADVALGDAIEGGNVFCKSSSNYWIVAPPSSEITRTWYSRYDAATTAQQVSGCTGWYIPTRDQAYSLFLCRDYWEEKVSHYWSNTNRDSCQAYYQVMYSSGPRWDEQKSYDKCVRAIRNVSY